MSRRRNNRNHNNKKDDGRNKQGKKENNKFNNDIKGVVLVALGLLMLSSIFLTSSTGTVGKSIREILFGFLGIGSYFCPFIIIAIGVSLIFKNGQVNYNKRFYGIIIFIFNLLLMVQILNFESHYTEGEFFKGAIDLFQAEHYLHGGLFSYILSVPLKSLFGKTGTYLIITAIYVISFVLIAQVTLKDIFLKVKSLIKIKKHIDLPSSSIKEKDILINDGQDSSEKDYINNINKKIKIVDFLKSTEKEKTSNITMETAADEESITPNSKVKDSKIKDNKSKDKNEEKVDISKEIEEKIVNVSGKTPEEYKYPSLDLLEYNPMDTGNKNNKKELLSLASKLEQTLRNFGVETKITQVTKGPTVTRFELQPKAGVKVSKITHLSDDIALSLAAATIRIEAPIPGKSAVGIEVPNKNVSPVYLKEVLESNEFNNSNKNVAFALGKDIGGNTVISDLSKMPHMLIAGATGSGKSVCINTLIISLLYKYSPEEVKLLLVDPKVVELNVYNDIPHLLVPVVTNPKKAAGALNWAVNEMTRRYKLFADNNVRNIESYNDLYKKCIIEEKIPWIVIIIDELADLMMVCPGEVEEYIGRLAQMARAAGMHLVIATQRPSVDVITGVIKANIPSRISFAVSSQIDSRTILDSAGAEKLLGKGDMLFYPVGASKPMRIQGAFISEEEVERIVNHIKPSKEEVQYEEKIIEEINTAVDNKDSNSDELLEEAIEIVINEDRASTSLLQRKLRIGYNRAARIIEELEEQGIISGRNGSKPRQVLIRKEDITES